MKKYKVHVFLSFEFDKDNELHRNFYAQAKEYSQYEIIDCSLNEPYYPDELWLNKARKQIDQSDIVIVVAGEDTHNAPGVIKEVNEAHQQKKSIFQIRPRHWTTKGVRGAGEVIRWEWKKIDARIAELLS